MSDMGIKDFLVGKDLLVEHNMKPWWEAFHGYFIAASLTIGLLLTYLVSPTDVVDCLPENPVGTGSSFSESQAALTNGFCVSQVPWYASYSGILCSGVAAMILVISNLWLSNPDVINGFRIFSKASSIILDFQSPTEKLKLVAVSPLSSSDEESIRMRKLCIFLWTYGTRIQEIYKIRNIIVLSTTAISLVGASYMSHLAFSLSKDPFFACSIPQNEPNISALDGYRDFLCSYNISLRIFPYLLLYILTLGGQILTLCVGIYKMYLSFLHDSPCQMGSDKFQISRNYANFMRVFFVNSHPIDSEGFAELIRFLFSDHALNAMSTCIEEAVTNVVAVKDGVARNSAFSISKMKESQHLNSDLEYVTLFSNMHYNGGNTVLATLFCMFESRKPYSNVSDIWEALGCFKFRYWSKEAIDFLKLAVERKQWPIVVKILNAGCTLPERSTMISLDQLEYGGINKNSILFYAFRKEVTFDEHSLNAARYALYCAGQYSTEVYVHFEGKSVKASNFIEQQRTENPTFSDSLHHDFITLLDNQSDMGKSTSPGWSLQEFGRLHRKYKNIVEGVDTYADSDKPITGNGRKPDNYHLLEEIAKDVSHLKFHAWTEDVSHFAKLAAEKRHWRIFSAILDAKIVEHSSIHPLEKPEVEDCGATYLPIDIPMEHNDWYGRSILCYILHHPTEIPQQSLTAFRHVLSCNWGKKLVVRELKRTRSLKEYVSKCSQLLDKEELNRWVENCEKGAPSIEETPDTDIKWPNRCMYM